MRVQSSKNDPSKTVYDETIEDGFHGFVEKPESFASTVGAGNIEIWSERTVIFFHRQNDGKISKTEFKQQQWLKWKVENG